MHAKEVGKGMCIRVNNVVYKVHRKEVITVGTHSHSKLKFFAKPMLSGGEKQFIFAHTDDVDVLELIKKRGQVLSLTGSGAQIMDSESYEIHDAEASPELTDAIEEGGPISFLEIDGKVFLVNAK